MTRLLRRLVIAPLVVLLTVLLWRYLKREPPPPRLRMAVLP